MSEKMLKFVNLDQQNPPKRSVDQRKTDFKEIYDEYINKKAKEQSKVEFLHNTNLFSRVKTKVNPM